MNGEHNINKDIVELWESYSAEDRREVSLRRYYLWEVLKQRFPTASKLQVILEDINGNSLYEAYTEQVSLPGLE